MSTTTQAAVVESAGAPFIIGDVELDGRNLVETRLEGGPEVPASTAERLADEIEVGTGLDQHPIRPSVLIERRGQGRQTVGPAHGVERGGMATDQSANYTP